MPSSTLFPALVTIHCSEATKQTGWFFTDDGYILTCGHGLADAKLGIGDSITAVRQSDGAMLDATVVELGHTPTNPTDYAILRAPGIHTRFLQVDRSMYELKYGTQYYAAGYAKHIDAGPVEFYGAVTSRERRPQDPRIQLSMVPGFPAAGLSGCPVLSETSNTVIGLQIAQAGATNEMLFALPISAILESSVEFRRRVQSMAQKYALRQWNIFQLDARLFPSPRIPRNDSRTIYIIKPMREDDQAQSIMRYVRDGWQDLQDRLNDLGDNLGLVEKKVPRFDCNLAVANVIQSNVHNRRDLSVYFASSFLEAPTARNAIRCICDLSGTINMDEGQPLQEVQANSHLIGLSRQPGDTLSIPRISGLDCRISIPTEEPKRAATFILSVIEDIITDIILFYSTKIIPQIFHSPNQRKRFSECKVLFAADNSLTFCGAPVTADATNYISLAGCSRPHPAAPIDYGALIKRWMQFVDGYLFQSVTPRDSPETPAATTDHICTLVRNSPKLGGHVSERRLRRRLVNFQASPGELCALAITRKSPKTRKETQALKALFGISTMRPNRPAVFNQSQLTTILAFRPCIHLFAFRWRMDP